MEKTYIKLALFEVDIAQPVLVYFHKDRYNIPVLLYGRKLAAVAEKINIRFLVELKMNSLQPPRCEIILVMISYIFEIMHLLE